jgi:hypothetical protein
MLPFLLNLAKELNSLSFYSAFFVGVEYVKNHSTAEMVKFE